MHCTPSGLKLNFIRLSDSFSASVSHFQPLKSIKVQFWYDLKQNVTCRCDEIRHLILFSYSSLWVMKTSTVLTSNYNALSQSITEGSTDTERSVCIVRPRRRNIGQRASAGATSTTSTIQAALTWSARSPQRCSTYWMRSASESFSLSDYLFD